jgi:hypothetical protein
MNVADELEKLQQLHQSGGISDDEFAKAKAKLLTTPTSGLDSLFGSGNTEQQTKQWAMFLHLSQLANCFAPPFGWIIPIVIWQVQKPKLPQIDEHGKVVCNWLISELLYLALCIPLCFVLIGIPLLVIVGILGIVFPIIGGMKANSGEVWKYPLSISFFK